MGLDALPGGADLRHLQLCCYLTCWDQFVYLHPLYLKSQCGVAPV